MARNVLTYFPQVPAVPNLPLAPRHWDTSYQDQFASVLRLYFNQTTGLLSAVMGNQGGRFLDRPLGSFYDSTRQVAVSTTVAYAIAIGNANFSNGVELTSGTRIKTTAPGLYNLQVAVQLANTDNASQDVDIWFRQNGSDIVNSNSRIGLAARKAVGDPFHALVTPNLFVNMVSGDYVEVMWRTTNVNAFIEAYAAGTAPTRPAIPSVIATMAFVSAPL